MKDVFLSGKYIPPYIAKAAPLFSCVQSCRAWPNPVSGGIWPPDMAARRINLVPLGVEVALAGRMRDADVLERGVSLARGGLPAGGGGLVWCR